MYNAYLHVGTWTRCFCMTESHWADIAFFNSHLVCPQHLPCFLFFILTLCHFQDLISKLSLESDIKYQLGWLATVWIQHLRPYDKYVLAITVQSWLASQVPSTPTTRTHTPSWWPHTVIWGRTFCPKWLDTGSIICKSISCMLTIWQIWAYSWRCIWPRKSKLISFSSCGTYTQSSRQLVPNWGTEHQLDQSNPSWLSNQMVMV